MFNNDTIGYFQTIENARSNDNGLNIFDYQEQHNKSIENKLDNNFKEAAALNNTGINFCILNKFNTALDYFKEALIKIKKNTKSKYDYNGIKAIILTNIATILLEQKKYDEAEKKFQEILKNFESVLAKFSNKLSDDQIMMKIFILRKNAFALQMKGDYETSISKYKEALDITPKKNNNHTYIKTLLLEDIATIFVKQKKYEKAIKKYEEAILLVSNNPFYNSDGLKAFLLEKIAYVLEIQNKSVDAKEHYDSAIKIYENLITYWDNNKKNNVPKAHTLNNIANILKKQNNYEKAIQKYEESFQELKNDNTFNNALSIMNILGNTVNILSMLNKYDEIIIKYNETIELIKLKKINNNGIDIILLNNIANILIKQKKYKEAITKYKEAFSLLSDKINNNNIPKASILNSIAIAFQKNKKYKEALKKYKEAFQIVKNIPDFNHIQVIILSNIAHMNFIDLNMFDEGLKYYKKIININPKYISYILLQAIDIGIRYFNFNEIQNSYKIFEWLNDNNQNIPKETKSLILTNLGIASIRSDKPEKLTRAKEFFEKSNEYKRNMTNDIYIKKINNYQHNHLADDIRKTS